MNRRMMLLILFVMALSTSAEIVAASPSADEAGSLSCGACRAEWTESQLIVSNANFSRVYVPVGATCGLVANYAVCFALDACRFDGGPHLLLFGFLGMVACLVVAPIASALKGDSK